SARTHVADFERARDCLSRSEQGVTQAQIGVGEASVRQAKAERKQGARVVGPVLVAVPSRRLLIRDGLLSQGARERSGQPALWSESPDPLLSNRRAAEHPWIEGRTDGIGVLSRPRQAKRFTVYYHPYSSRSCG